MQGVVNLPITARETRNALRLGPESSMPKTQLVPIRKSFPDPIPLLNIIADGGDGGGLGMKVGQRDGRDGARKIKPLHCSE